jgi:4-hydroxy-tetrahydrodipicolinate reductase
MKIVLIGAYGRMGKAVTSLAENHTIIKVGSKDPLSLDSCDVVLDFSTPAAVYKHLPLIVAAEKPWVIGVTGLDTTPIIEAATKIPIFHSPNFSYGIALLKELTRYFPKGRYTITDRHHIDKKDSPSGTALALAQSLPSPPKISSYREGEVIGEHTITLSLPFEELQFHHTVLDRGVFAHGALTACSFLVDKPAKLYTSIYDENR